MKFLGLMLGFVLVCSLVIAGYIHTRRKRELYLSKQASFLDIKFRVSRDVLGEYQEQLTQSDTGLEKTLKELDTLNKDLLQDKVAVAQKKTEAGNCKGDKKRLTDEIAASGSETKRIQDEFAKNKSQWEMEVISLKKQLEQESSLCKYIDKTSAEGRKLCNIIEEPKKPEEPAAEKPEEPAEKKPEEPAAENPKAEEKEVKAANAEQPKVNVQ